MGWLKSFICEVFGNVFPAFDNSFDILKLIKTPLAKSDYKKVDGKIVRSSLLLTLSLVFNRNKLCGILKGHGW